MRFRKKGDGGGFKFKRTLSVDWVSISPVNDTENIVNETTERAYIFGQPPQPLIINGIDFINYKFSDEISLTTSNGRSSPIVCGALFSPPTSVLNDAPLRAISSIGAWAPRLPREATLDLSISNLSVDNLYEIKFFFAGSGRLTTSKQMLLSPSDGSVDFNDAKFIVVTGTFIAPTSTAEFKIGSRDAAPPYINALTLSPIGFAPRTTATFFSAS